MRSVFVVLIAVTLAGCPSPVPDRNDAAAEEFFAAAEQLEAAGMYGEAMHQYALIVQEFPGSRHSAPSLKRLGMLSALPENPARNDSAALSWFRMYLPLATESIEQSDVHLHIRLLERITAIRAELGVRDARIDSAAQKSERLASELSARNRRIQQLEAELAGVASELRKLREIDVQIQRRSGKK